MVGCDDRFVIHRGVSITTSIRYSNLKAVTKRSFGVVPVVVEELLEAVHILDIRMKNNPDRFVSAVVNEKINCVWVRQHVAINSNSRVYWRLF